MRVLRGPFSAFDGYDRTLALVRGALLDGPSTDLNLIVARERAEAEVHVPALLLVASLRHRPAS